MHDPQTLITFAAGASFAKDYRIVRPLNQGGMGAVYVVEQISTGRERALKVMHPRLVQDPKLRKRFEQEAWVGGKIESAHVVEVLAAGVDESTGMPWLCMELLKGQDLGAFIASRAPVPVAEVLGIFREMCHALGAAHAVGVVHRDLKPENVFLASSRQASAPYVLKVLDFGIAKIVADGSKTDTSPIGTPLWMAPEQTVPGATIGPTADVWAMGLIAFSMLTGRSYWRAAHDGNASAYTLIREIAFEPLAAASDRSREVGGAPLPDGFEGWFARCVVRETEARFPDAAQAWEAFAAALGGGAMTQPRVSDDFGAAVDATMPTAAYIAAKSDEAGASAVALRAPSLGGVAHTVDPPQGDGPDAGEARTHADPVAAPEDSADADPDDAPDRSIPKTGRGLGLGLVGLVGLAAALYFARGTWFGPEAPLGAGSASPSSSANDARELEENKLKLAERRGRLDVVLGKMARVESATFQMGADDGPVDEQPPHSVTVASFELDVLEVSVSAYRACLDAGFCPTPQVGQGCNWAAPGRAAHPMNCVTWTQAKSFCEWAAKRLPTESEWEIAARGTDGRTYPWGRSPPQDEACWKRGAEGAAPAKGSCVPGELACGDSPYGIKDLAGNVSEWTSSSYCPYSRPGCGAASKIVRGGAFQDAEPDALRSTRRSKRQPEANAPELGFRCARDALY